MRKTQFASCFIVATLLGVNQLAWGADPAHPDQPVVAPTEAISKLKKGNGRAFAVIVGCADSRVLPEIVFDQGPGDLFVLRVAGDVIDDKISSGGTRESLQQRMVA
jgi:carbonic anhydrase